MWRNRDNTRLRVIMRTVDPGKTSDNWISGRKWVKWCVCIVTVTVMVAIYHLYITQSVSLASCNLFSSRHMGLTLYVSFTTSKQVLYDIKTSNTHKDSSTQTCLLLIIQLNVLRQAALRSSGVKVYQEIANTAVKLRFYLLYKLIPALYLK